MFLPVLGSLSWETSGKTQPDISASEENLKTDGLAALVNTRGAFILAGRRCRTWMELISGQTEGDISE